jgi:RNA polymerase sigma-70 factor (ECF subfamily)
MPTTTRGDLRGREAAGSSGDIGGPTPSRRFIQLFRQYEQDVRRVCWRFGIHSGDVDDIVQRVFLIALAKIHLICSGSERSFLTTITAREAGHLRRTYGRRAEVDDRALDPRSSGATRLDEKLHQRRILEHATEVLEEMDVELSSAWLMYELQGLSCQEIARAQSVPVGTAKTRLRRARMQLSSNGTPSSR